MKIYPNPPVGAPQGESLTTAAPAYRRKDGAALRSALTALKVSLRYNLRKQKPEIMEAGGDWLALTDRNSGALRDQIEQKFTYQTPQAAKPLRYGGEAWHTYCNSIFDEHEVDPFLVWLEALPDWDGVARCGGWLGECFELAPGGDPALSAWASRFIILGPVWRTYEPGTKLDEMPVLTGPQGIGKSTALRLLLPPGMDDLFADGLYLAAPPQARAEALQGRVMVEASEMAGQNRADLESLKSFLSCTDDGAIRLAYRRNPECTPRRCIIVGTSNVPDPLPNDPTGLRRFVVVRLARGNAGAVAHYLDRNRVQLWAEGVALYREGVLAWLPPKLQAAQSAANETGRRRDEVLEDAVAQWTVGRDRFTLPEAAEGVGLIKTQSEAATLPQRDQKRLGAALTVHGYVKRREMGNGVRTSLWAAA